MRFVHPIDNSTTATDAGIACQEYVYIWPRLRVVPDFRGLLWAMELKLYLDMRRPRVGPCDCKRCRQDEEDEYWDVLCCGGCDGLRRVGTPCPRCDSDTYKPTSPTDARKGPPTGFGPYRGAS